MAPHPIIDDYHSAEDAIAAASELEMRGYWKDTIALYHGIAKRWPEHLPYITDCINTINDKQQLSHNELLAAHACIETVCSLRPISDQFDDHVAIELDFADSAVVYCGTLVMWVSTEWPDAGTRI